MARRLPECPDTPAITADQVKHQYEIHVVTPMFGGGVAPGHRDPIAPVRATSVRGHLRFWWRATRGACCVNPSDLRRRESEIWGDTRNPSKVVVRVEIVDPGRPIPCARFERDKAMPVWEQGWPAYALFPFGGNKERRDPAKEALLHTRFRLLLMRDASVAEEDVIEPLRAWLWFGGLGARTRRGCGTLFCQEHAPLDIAAISTWASRLMVGSTDREWPVLGLRLLVGPTGQPIDVWKRGVDLLQRFRQGPGVGRNPGESNRPGRSRWPEPETVRRLTGRRDPRHQRQQHIPEDGFPRAAFGMPLIFHFKDRGDPPGPPDPQLIPVSHGGQSLTRMGSPLILKPLVLRSGDAVPVVLWLRSPAPAGVRLEHGHNSYDVRAPISDSRFASYQDSPLAHRSPGGSALEAFCALAREQDFEEVVR